MRVPVWSHDGECYCESPQCRERGVKLVDVRPSGSHPDSGRGDWRGTCLRCGAVQDFEVVNPSYDPWANSDRVADVLAALSVGSTVVGQGWSVGPLHGAVEGPVGCAVVDLRGAPVLLTDDLFEAAREYVRRVQREEDSQAHPPTWVHDPGCTDSSP